jgi:SAM-dependent methyltransferase
MTSAAGWDPTWDSVFKSRAWGRYPPEPVIREVMRAFGNLPDRRSVRFLDLGCGPGANTWFLTREGFAVSGIDGSPTAIAQNRARLQGEGLDADLRVGDFTERLPWDDAHFDAVVDNASVYGNPQKAMAACFAEVLRVLKPGGLFLSLAFSDRTWGYGMVEQGQDPGSVRSVEAGPLKDTGYVQFLSRVDVDRLFAAFTQHSIERSSYTLQGQLVELWVVVCRRAGA